MRSLVGVVHVFQLFDLQLMGPEQELSAPLVSLENGVPPASGPGLSSLSGVAPVSRRPDDSFRREHFAIASVLGWEVGYCERLNDRLRSLWKQTGQRRLLCFQLMLVWIRADLPSGQQQRM